MCRGAGLKGRGQGARYHGGSVGKLWPSEESSYGSDPRDFLNCSPLHLNHSNGIFHNGHEEEDQLGAAEQEPVGGERLYLNNSLIVA